LVLGHTSGAATLNRGLTLSSGALTIGNTFNFDTGAAAGTRSINLGSTYGSGTWNINNGATIIGVISSSGFSSNVGFRAGVGGGATAVDFGWAGSSGLYSPTANSISIANNNARVANFSTTALTLDYTTAGASNAGALVVAGGISAGNTGSAASYFGGAVTIAGDITLSNAASTPTFTVKSSLFGATCKLVFGDGINNDQNTLSSQGGTLTISRNATALLTLSNTTATFAGAVAIGNTVAAGIAVASTHKVTMVIGGVTYYLLASNV
jgi:hypothetical protein